MRSAVLFVALILPTAALAQFDAQHPPPDWMVIGFEAAVADPGSLAAVERVRALAGLAQYLVPGDAGAAVERLMPLLVDSVSDVRSEAAQSLAKIATGDRAVVVVDKLLPFLGDSNPVARSAAAQALAKIAIGDRAVAAIDRLTPLLGDSNRNVRSAAAQALGQIPLGDRASVVVDKLLPLLGDSYSDVRSAAAEALAKIANRDRAVAVVDKLLPLLGDLNSDVRSAAAQALAKIAPGDRAGVMVDTLLPLLGDSDISARQEAAQALAKIATGDHAVAVIDRLLPLLGDEQFADVQSMAARALGQMTPGGRASAVVDRLLPLLGYSNFSPRFEAAQALGQITPGDRAVAVVDKLLPLLGDSYSDVRSEAAQSLAKIATGDRAVVVVDKLLPLLGDSNPFARSGAAEALAKIAPGDRAGVVVDTLLPLLGDSSNDARSAAAGALGKIMPGDRTGAAIDKLMPLLDDSDSGVRSAAAGALGKITSGDRSGAVVDKLLALLADSDIAVGSAAAQALGQITPGDRAGAVIDKLLPLLGDSNGNVSSAALNALSRIGPGGVSVSLATVRLINAGRDEDAGRLRAAAHIATGADAKKEGSELLLAWLGRPVALPLETVADNPAQAQKVLQLLTNNWVDLSKEPRAREEAENAAMAAIEAACRTPGEASSLADFASASVAWFRDLPIEGPVHRCWTPEQKPTVEKLLADFKQSHSTHVKALEAELKAEDLAPVGLWLTRSFVAWTLLWVAFLVAFPWSRTIQAIFFWNPRARRFFSAGFVPLLLFVVPPLRRRLLAPFREDLVAQARLDDLPKLGYFAEGHARVNGGEPVPVAQLQTGLSGVAVLQADSGLGKTSLLREMAAKAKRPVAFLHARDCADGVDGVGAVGAVARLIHDVQETGFVRSLVHTRALIVIVDGLNEVSADTREKIGAFARDMSKGDVIVATQPIEWRPPPNSRTVELLPLDRNEATAFIESRPVGADPNQHCHGAAYKVAAEKFVSRALDGAPSETERETAELMLSNPFDLAFAAELLARGRMPSPTALADEAFRLADERYRAIAKVPFPLAAFGRHAVTMRLEDRNWLNPNEFTAEASCLLEQRLLVSRALKGAQGTVDRLLFRHDRVWDFFIAAAFAKDPDLWAEHVGDARFRRAYLRIAETWDPESARKVRDQLNVAAAHSGDHSTSDEFIKRLEKRLRVKKSAAPHAVGRRA
jgi:HEAT repeat protein